MSKINLLHIDCMEHMKYISDNHYDLAIVDPPYGNDNITGGYTKGKGGGIAKQKNYHKELWKQKRPDIYYMKELIQISKNQIIWGANHLADLLPFVSSGWVFWDKNNNNNSFSDGELAWTSFNVGLRMYKYTWNGMIQQNMKNKEFRIHPTQKPVQLYKWLLMNYANPGDTIFDSHGGSMSLAIAAYDLDFDCTICEIDKDYYDSAVKRFEHHKSQITLQL